jgi:alginate O-acetyltransferase complex protein AlgJ
MLRDARAWGAFVAGLAVVAACHAGGARYPWGGAESRAAEHAEVRTLNDGYQRTRSKVWVRQIERPTRAALDYAAYHANFMIADLEPESPLPATREPDTSKPFAGVIDGASLTSDITKTALSAAERQQPLAFPPLAERLQSRKVEGADALAEAGSAVRAERWGLTLPPGISGQQLSELCVHKPASGPAELWAKIEFQPWFSAFKGSADQDGDGFPEIYGRLQAKLASPAIVSEIEQDYVAKVLSPSEVKAWANQLSSYWYPSFNTDLMPAGESWPDEQTEPEIKRELGGRSFASPAIVLRGKPQGKPTYNVFLIGGASTSASAEKTAAPSQTLKLAKSRPTPDPKPLGERLRSELERDGKGDYSKWQAALSPFHDYCRKRLKAMPPKVKALAGRDGFLFYRNSLEYVIGGDLEKQKKGKNPLPVIVEFKKQLDALGVDFLFVPVPTKVEVYPEKLAPDFDARAGVVNPYFRKLLASLSREGVEVVDLLPALLAAKQDKTAGLELLFQHQDTHWTDRGLRLAADLLSTRIKRYPWYAELAKHSKQYGVRETSFTRFGDLQSRLPDAEQKKYTPETLVAHQVLRADKQPYDDDPDSPIVLLGDSFTGVYELTDAEHAGVSAHIARGISYPLDLVMSYGGGPNVRQKLLRRGSDSLATKKLVIWMMTARDLYNYWEDWEPLKKP